MVLLKCNKKIDEEMGICGYEWEYKGNKKVYATCPDCMKRILIEECKVKEPKKKKKKKT